MLLSPDQGPPGPGKVCFHLHATANPSPTQDLPIGVFDSGVGGLTVLKALYQRLPQESFLYFGDTAHVPYGTRSQDEILGFARQILSWMVQQPVKMAIMACNTSSALALDIVRKEFNIPILGLILPGARAAVRQGQKIGIIATPATVDSQSYLKAIQEINPNAEVYQVACPEFVPLIERDRLHDPHTRHIVQHYLSLLLDAQIDTLVYGCTHYPHLAPVISQILPPAVAQIDPAIHIAHAAAQELELLQLKSTQSLGQTRFYVSGDPQPFAQISAQWLGYRPPVEAVELLVTPIPASLSESVNEVTL